MKLGDYVWFRMKDDAAGFVSFTQDDPGYIAGKIIKHTPDLKRPIFWIMALPIVKDESMQLWAIPTDLVKEMTPEEITLAILENL